MSPPLSPVSSTSPAPSGPDLDLRLVRYFVVVAEHLNFGRAATALHVAQPSLSRQIQRLEHQLGARLFDRTPQGSSLTVAGKAFLPQAEALLDAASGAVLAAREAAPQGTITVGYVEGLIVTPAVRELRRRHPDAQVRSRHLSWQDAAALPERRVDALVTRLPLPLAMDRLDVTVLYEEPWVLVAPLAHPLAGRASVTPADLAQEELVFCNSAAAIWSFARSAGAPLDGLGLTAPTVDDSLEDKIELVATGHGLLILPAGDRRTTLRSDLATVPVEGFDPSQVVVVTRANDRNPLVSDFRRAASVMRTASE